MAKSQANNGPGHNSAVEKPYFDRLVDLNRQMEALRDDIKEVCSEAKESDIQIQPLKLAVKRHLETEKERNARLGRETEAERILRALGEFINTPLGEAAGKAFGAGANEPMGA